jgi:hypothetical protein
MKSNEIKAKELDLTQQIAELQKQRENALVEEGKAYHCKKCKAFVDKEKINTVPMENGLCSNCHGRMRVAEEERKLLDKLKLAKIIDIELDGYWKIKKLTVYKNGMMYELEASYDRDFDDEAHIVIDREYEDRKQRNLEEEQALEIKPRDKKRTERPLMK